MKKDTQIQIALFAITSIVVLSIAIFVQLNGTGIIL